MNNDTNTTNNVPVETKKKESNLPIILGIISMVLFFLGPIIFIFLISLPKGVLSNIELASNIMATAGGIGILTGLILAIFIKIRYPSCAMGTVLIILYIVLIGLVLLGLALLGALCNGIESLTGCNSTTCR